MKYLWNDFIAHVGLDLDVGAEAVHFALYPCLKCSSIKEGDFIAYRDKETMMPIHSENFDDSKVLKALYGIIEYRGLLVERFYFTEHEYEGTDLIALVDVYKNRLLPLCNKLLNIRE